MPFDESTEFELLKRRCNAVGLYVNRHREFDATFGTGDLYIMPRKTHANPKPLSLLTYATLEQAHAFVNQWTKEQQQTGGFDGRQSRNRCA
jgi:hypothetical protein